MTKQQMLDAGWEALDEGRPFTDLETRKIRYWGDDEQVLAMMIAQVAA